LGLTLIAGPNPSKIQREDHNNTLIQFAAKTSMWMSLPLGAPPSFPSTPAFGDHLVTPLGKNYTNHHDTHREELQGGARIRAKQRDKGHALLVLGRKNGTTGGTSDDGSGGETLGPHLYLLTIFLSLRDCWAGQVVPVWGKRKGT
jgi:hypothetical protein